MALCPFAEQKLLPESATQAAIRPRAVIAHSAGGEAELYGWWQNDESRGLESHFWVGRDGRTVQYIDTEVRADANGQANSFAVSIETASTVHATERWDPPQARALVRLIDWLCDVHDIPREQMVKPTSSGLGWHVMFGAPGPWTPSKGKVCPGPARIDQFVSEIIPAVQAAATIVHPTPDPKDPFMALTEDEQKEILEFVRTRGPLIDATDQRVRQLQNELVAPMGGDGKSRADRWSDILTALDPRKKGA
jgi:hypothetical protein